MQREERKAAIAAYKERKVEAGIYGVRCTPTGQQWVGSTPNLGTIWNRLAFTLRQGSNTHRSLQAAWSAHGAGAFGFEILERIEAEELAYLRDRVLRERLAHWAGTLGAQAIQGGGGP